MITADPVNAIFLGALVLTAIVFFLKPRLGLFFIILLPAAGELARLPFGPENGILLSDALIAVYLVVWIWKKYIHSQKNKPLNLKDPLLLPVIIFTGVAAASLIQSILFLSLNETVVSSLYLIRYIEYVLLYRVALELDHAEPATKNIFRTVIVSALLVAFAGFIQLLVYPDLADLEEAGWDPHINRLVSTWLDPNFVGGMLALVMTVALGVFSYEKKFRRKMAYLMALAVMGGALFLTYSRSAYLALGLGILTVGILKSRKMLVTIVILFLLGISVSDRARERVEELATSVGSIFASTAETPDPTAKLRIESWENSLGLFIKRPVLGSGFNTLRYVNYNEGFVTDPGIHSASGSDSSLLTVLATTGMAGMIPFVMILWVLITAGYKNWRSEKTTGFEKGLGLGFFGGILGLLVHSVFVNSLFYAYILLYLWPLAGCMLAIADRTTNGSVPDTARP